MAVTPLVPHCTRTTQCLTPRNTSTWEGVGGCNPPTHLEGWVLCEAFCATCAFWGWFPTTHSYHSMPHPTPNPSSWRLQSPHLEVGCEAFCATCALWGDSPPHLYHPMPPTQPPLGEGCNPLHLEGWVWCEAFCATCALWGDSPPHTRTTQCLTHHPTPPLGGGGLPTFSHLRDAGHLGCVCEAFSTCVTRVCVQGTSAVIRDWYPTHHTRTTPPMPRPLPTLHLLEEGGGALPPPPYYTDILPLFAPISGVCVCAFWGLISFGKW